MYDSAPSGGQIPGTACIVAGHAPSAFWTCLQTFEGFRTAERRLGPCCSDGLSARPAANIEVESVGRWRGHWLRLSPFVCRGRLCQVCHTGHCRRRLPWTSGGPSLASGQGAESQAPDRAPVLLSPPLGAQEAWRLCEGHLGPWCWNGLSAVSQPRGPAEPFGVLWI